MGIVTWEHCGISSDGIDRTIGLYISYALPTIFRITIDRKTFRPGPFHLGRYSLVVGWVAVIWVAFITVLFCLPVVYPVTSSTLNYTPVAIGGLFVLIMLSWLLGARKWFKGPPISLDGYPSLVEKVTSSRELPRYVVPNSMHAQ
jgi:hypothetical protein